MTAEFDIYGVYVGSALMSAPIALATPRGVAAK
jgi:hypothetical protein